MGLCIVGHQIYVVGEPYCEIYNILTDKWSVCPIALPDQYTLEMTMLVTQKRYIFGFGGTVLDINFEYAEPEGPDYPEVERVVKLDTVKGKKWEVIEFECGGERGSLYGVVLLNSTYGSADFLLFGGKDSDVFALRRMGVFKTEL